jgi:4a-hydroxytetrahydrobiopterin dehydratase
MRKFTDKEIISHISKMLNNWTFEEDLIKRDFEFMDFIEAFSFMTSVALLAEHLDHHPDWSNAYNKVSIALSTHSAGGITQLDFDLAAKIDQAFSSGY